MRLLDEYALARKLLSAEDLEDGIHPPLTEAERRFNYAQARAFTTEPVGESPLLFKPLFVDAGGRYHAPNADVFPTRQSDGYRAIEDWMRGRAGVCP